MLQGDNLANGIRVMSVDPSTAYLVYLARQGISSKFGDTIADYCEGRQEKITPCEGLRSPSQENKSAELHATKKRHSGQGHRKSPFSS